MVFSSIEFIFIFLPIFFLVYYLLPFRGKNLWLFIASLAFYSYGVLDEPRYILLLIISIFIISNTIKLTVHARRKEISIMKYVGATNGFIRWPFVVEGMIIGIFASLISIVIVGGAYNLLAEQFANTQFIQIIGVNLVTFQDMLSSIIIVYLLLGIGIGALGSIISMRKYLKV